MLMHPPRLYDGLSKLHNLLSTSLQRLLRHPLALRIADLPARQPFFYQQHAAVLLIEGRETLCFCTACICRDCSVSSFALALS